jgi:hypothetical protein
LSTGYVLEFSGSLAENATWTTATHTVEGDENVVIQAIVPNAVRYYRLKK